MKQDINKFITNFHIFQKRNRIRNLCCSNTIILYRFGKNKLNIKLEMFSGYLFMINSKGRGTVVEHCWCEYNGIILEPSYQYSNTYIKYKKYIKKFCDIPKFYMKDISIDRKKELLKSRNILKKDLDTMCNDDRTWNNYIYVVAQHIDFI